MRFDVGSCHRRGKVFERLRGKNETVLERVGEVFDGTATRGNSSFPSRGVLLIKAPDLLEKRLNAKEEEAAQKAVVALSALLFVGGFVVAGLDFRFDWSHVPLWAVILASVILLASYALYGEVMRENAYLSRTVEVQENQKVVDTGLYGVVRHPMYAVTLWLFLAIPVVLGSWWSLLCFLPYVAVLVVRIRNEERVLEEGLEGYAEYKKRVKYRLLPFVW